MRDIICTCCSEPAIRFTEPCDPSALIGLEFRCCRCDAPGKVEQVDDGEQAMLVFRTEDGT